MKRWTVLLVPVEPVSIGQGPPWANVQTSAAFVPGSAWRGALARALLAAEGVPVGSHWAGGSLPPDLQRVWERLFFEERAPRFGFLYPVGRSQASWAASGRVWPFAPPLSANSCKYHPGYKEPAAGRGSSGSAGHGVADLVLGAIREFIEGQEQPGAPGGRPAARSRGERVCPVCHVPLERFKKLSAMVREDAEGQEYRFATTEPPMRYLTRVGIDRHTSTASESLLYSLQVLEPAGHVFLGSLRASDVQMEELVNQVGRIPADEEEQAGAGSTEPSTGAESLLGSAPDLQEGGSRERVLRVKVRIGAARARGLGQAWVLIWQSEEWMGSLEDRLRRFQPRSLSGGGPNGGVSLGPLLDETHLYFSLTLRAPAIVRSPEGTLTMEVSPRVLEAYGFPVPPGLEWIRQASFVDPSVVSGWSLAWGLPKPTTVALAAGSVLTYRAPAGERETVLRLLQDLEERGLGERVREGYGEVQACFPFHWQLDCGLQRRGDSALAREEVV